MEIEAPIAAQVPTITTLPAPAAVATTSLPNSIAATSSSNFSRVNIQAGDTEATELENVS